MWQTPGAVAWLKNHGYRASKLDVTGNFLRFRQRDPVEGDRYRTRKLADSGVELVIGYPRTRGVGISPWTVISIGFNHNLYAKYDHRAWSQSEALGWLRNRGLHPKRMTHDDEENVYHINELPVGYQTRSVDLDDGVTGTFARPR